MIVPSRTREFRESTRMEAHRDHAASIARGVDAIASRNNAARDERLTIG